MTTMTYQQATDQAVKLRSQGLTFKQIEDHLKTVGYISSRTKAPVKEMAIRYMVSKEEKTEKQEKRQELEDEKIYVVQNEQSLRTSIKTLLALPEFSQDMKLRLVQALVEEGGGKKAEAKPRLGTMQSAQATA